MATIISTALHPSATNAALIRAWAQFIEDTLVSTGGWVVTADTGQTIPSSLPPSGGPNTVCGYRIYTMNDALQATAPVFMKVEFGQATPSGNIPGIWVTIGKSSDGAGNVTNVMMSRTPVFPITNFYSDTLLTNSYGSADINRVVFCLFVQGAQPCFLCFSIERTKNALGADTADGLLIMYTSGRRGQAVDASRYLSYLTAVQPVAELGIAYLLTSQNPTQTFGGDIGVGVITHFRGIAQQPGINMVVVNSLDVAAEGSFTTTIYGASRTYQHLNILLPCRLYTTPSLSGSAPEDGNARMCMRFD